MSTFEDYNSACSEYDNQMTAAGSDVIAGMIHMYTGKHLRDVHVLDAGCGTGNYAKALLDAGVGSITLLDASSGMLDKARTKLAEEVNSGKVKAIVEAKMPPLPFNDSTFDVVIFSQVLHHIGTSDDGTYPQATSALCEGRRALCQNGVIIISTALPSIFSNAIWFTQLNAALTTRYTKIIPSLDDFNTMLGFARLKCCQKLNILGWDLVKNYHRYDGPLDAAWRRAIAYWSFATEAELEDVKDTVLQMKQAGTLETWCRQHDNTSNTGIFTLLFCKAE